MLAGTKRPFADTELGEEAFNDPDQLKKLQQMLMDEIVGGMTDAD